LHGWRLRTCGRVQSVTTQLQRMALWWQWWWWQHYFWLRQVS
jgi:hypothetical protein